MRRRVIFAVISGLMLVAAHPPIGVGLMAWIAFVPFFLAIDGATAKQSALLGFISGVVFYLGDVYWVVNSMYYYGNVPLWISVPVMVVLAAFLAVYTGVFAWLVTAVGKERPLLGVLLIPAVWVSFEYLRANLFLFTGFPWSLLGYTQFNQTHLIQIADVTGVYGLSYLVMMVNVVAYQWVKSVREQGGGKPLSGTGVAAIALALTIIYGFAAIGRVDGELLRSRQVKVSVAQGAIDQGVKWDSSYRMNTVDIYRKLSMKAAEDGASLIIWPESAMPFFLGQGVKETAEETRRATGAAKETNTYILTGAPAYNYNFKTAEPGYFNSAYLIAPDGALIGRYDKVHLVPFGEYVPMKNVLWFVKKLTVGAGDFVSGHGAYPIAGFPHGSLGVLICYEAVFPEIAAEAVRNGASILVNITNDAWFGRSSAPYQHLEMSALRAVENRRFLLRAANTGISAIVDPAGRIKARTTLFEKTVLTGEAVFTKEWLTFYTMYGDVFAYGCLVFGAAGAVVILKKKKRERHV
ncbi:MAG: apolipoprotein N-acyltransferase [Deltaproteobacteria bacterium]